MEGHEPHVFEDFFPRYFDSMDYIMHYTCNSPTKKVLKKYGIEAKGKEFNCSNDLEILKIPFKVYSKFGFSRSSLKNKDVLKINLERLMTKLE